MFNKIYKNKVCKVNNKTLNWYRITANSIIISLTIYFILFINYIINFLLQNKGVQCMQFLV